MVKKADFFEFSDYSVDWDSGVLRFTYAVQFADERKEFEEKLQLKLKQEPKEAIKNLVDGILKDLHLMLGISYYKLYCPESIKIQNYSLTKDQADFWKTVYTKGLGEFFYQNKLDYRNLIKFPHTSFKSELELPAFDIVANKALVPIGGGKDSIVTIETLKKENFDFDLFSLKKYPVQEAVANVVGKEIHFVERFIDPQVIQLNKSDTVYNGHVPISAIYAFVALLYSAINGYQYIVLSNEKSSDYGNVEYLGQEMNHQWSKTKEFEKLFQDYIATYRTKDIKYFSLLRPIYEIQISKLFTQYPEYFEVFSSSNHNFKINQTGETQRWDYASAKTAFVFAMLASFLPREEVMKIFKKNLYDDENVVNMYQELLGAKNVKPFDCVGTPEEVMVAMSLALDKGEYKNSKILNFFSEEILPNTDIETLEKEVFSYGDDSMVPKKFQILKK